MVQQSPKILASEDKATLLEEDQREIELTQPGRQKVERQTSWQLAEHAKIIDPLQPGKERTVDISWFAAEPRITSTRA